MKKGFTLVEILVSSAIMLVLLVAVASAAKESLQLSRSSLASMNAELDSRRAVRTIIRELRGATTLVATSSDSVIFTLDLDSDGVDEQISFLRNANNLLIREEPNSTRTLAENISTVQLFTYDGKYIEVRFAVGGKEYSSGVTLRNIE